MLNQLEEFAAFIEHLADNPPGPYRPADLARTLGRTESRVRRWLLLLAERNWLVRHGKQFYQSGKFRDWGDKYATCIIRKDN